MEHLPTFVTSVHTCPHWSHMSINFSYPTAHIASHWLHLSSYVGMSEAAWQMLHVNCALKHFTIKTVQYTLNSKNIAILILANVIKVQDQLCPQFCF